MTYAIIRAGAAAILAFALSSAPSAHAQAGPSACLRWFMDAGLGTWESTRVWREGAGVMAGIADVTTTRGAAPNVYDVRIAVRGGPTFTATSTVTATGSEDVVYDPSGAPADRASGKEVLRCDAAAQDGWRTLEIRYEGTVGGVQMDMLQHYEIGDNATIFINSVRPRGSPAPYRWRETITSKRTAPPAP